MCLGPVVSRHGSNASSPLESSRSWWVAIGRKAHLPVDVTVSAEPEERHPHPWVSEEEVEAEAGRRLWLSRSSASVAELTWTPGAAIRHRKG